MVALGRKHEKDFEKGVTKEIDSGNVVVPTGEKTFKVVEKETGKELWRGEHRGIEYPLGRLPKEEYWTGRLPKEEYWTGRLEPQDYEDKLERKRQELRERIVRRYERMKKEENQKIVIERNQLKARKIREAIKVKRRSILGEVKERPRKQMSFLGRI